ncbi:MAG TPA: SURF1 family protein [Steroidobacteraceae bacterium]|nr:SURF1 family protein [Steroidobacteraceae bacterium]
MARRFSPRWHWTLAVLLVVPLFVSLGFWQWHRGEHRSAQWAEFSRTDVPAVEASAASLERLERFTRVRVSGVLDPQRQFLLDNISHEGAPGYEVLTVLQLADGSHLLVNRGWLPFSGYRDRLPDVAFDAGGTQWLTGRLSTLPVAGMASGRQPPALEGSWPRLASFPTREELQRSRGEALLSPVLLLDADGGPGYLRDWRAPGISPDRNYSYAVQWWSFALLAVAMYIGLNLKRRA